MVRHFDITVHLARTRPYSPADEGPINPGAPFQQTACGSGRGARRRHCILELSLRDLQLHCRFRSIHIEVAGNNDGAVRVVTGRIRQDLVQLLVA